MWEIYAYHNSVSLFGIFNAIAAVMGSGSYMGSVAVVLFVGFLVAMFSYAFQPQKLQGWQWLASVVIVYSILFLPRVTVQIVDKTGGAPVQVVDNVPLGMAALGGLTSTVGNSVTELFELAFQIIPGRGALPAEMSYQQTGLMFGSRVIQHTRSVSFPDPAFKADMLSFLTSCTAYDVADGSISASDLARTDDIWTLVRNTNPARFTRISGVAGINVATCSDAWTSLDSRIGANVSELRSTLATALNPSIPAGAAATLIDGQILQAYTRSQIAAASATATGLILQNAMINSVSDAAQLSCQQISDPSCMLGATARAQAVAQQNSAWINGARISADALPVVRNVAEALIYAIFPLVVLLLFMTSGRTTVTVLQSYLAVLISIQLWPPLFAILNYMASIYSQTSTASAADLGGGITALTARTADPIYSTSISGQAVVSYVMTAIPFLAWSLANRLTNLGATLIGGTTAMQSTTAAATSAATSGNVSMGNVSMDQRMVSPSTSNAFVSQRQDSSGNWITTDGTGRRSVRLLKNEGITSFVVSTQATQSDVESANRSASTSASELLSASSAQSSSLTQALTRARGTSNSAASTAGQGRSSADEVSQAADSLWSEARNIAKATGYNENQVAGVLFKFSAMPSAGGIGGGAATEKRYGVSLSAEEKAILAKSGSESFRAARSFAERASRDTGFLNRLSEDGQGGSSLASTLTGTTSRVKSAERSFNEASSWAQQVQSSLTNGTTISRDLAKDPAYFDAVMRYEREAAHYQNNPQALQALWAATIGSVASTPTTFRNGAPTFASDGAVRAQYNASRSDVAVNPDVPGASSGNNQVVQSRALPAPPTAPSVRTPGAARLPGAPGSPSDGSDPLADPSRARQDIRSEGARLSGTVSGAVDGFDDRHNITRREDGSVVTRKSMVGRSMGMVGDDAVLTDAEYSQRMEEARQRAKDSPLQKDRDATSEIPTMLPSTGKRQPPK